jgi:hypothetical protein
MASTIKVTFTLDQTSIERLQDAADRLALPKSEVVREAIIEFHDRLGQLSARERSRMLRAFDELVPLIPPRGEPEVKRELAQLRRARRASGRRTPAERG